MSARDLRPIQIDPAELLAEPLPITKLARLFNVGRGKMAAILRNMAGVERHASLWRVPLLKMPPRYFHEAGLLQPADLCPKLHESAGTCPSRIPTNGERE